MKTFYCALFFLLTFSISQAQWTNQNPVPDQNDLWSTFFIDDSTGWIVGSVGFIKKTTNNGVDWIQQNSGTSLTLKSVQFIDQNTGWICGESGLILKTTDGGLNWSQIASGTTQDLTDIYFYNLETGYAVGNSGVILKSTNGGLVWFNQISGTTVDLSALDFVDTNIGYAVGGYDTLSTILKTTDGGISWIDKSGSIPYPLAYRRLNAVEFVNAYTGFIGYSHTLYKTTDGGDTWIESPILTTESKGINKTERLSIYPMNGGIKSIFFKDVNNGWYLIWSGVDNYIYRTTNCGINWEPELRRGDWEHSSLSLFVKQNGTGLAVGAYGLIYSKAESDSGWSRLFSGRNDKINSIYFVNEHFGFASAFRYGNPYKSVILKTTNGGKIWKTVREALGADPRTFFYFINEMTGWAILGDELSAVEAGGGIYNTTDGGENWAPVNPSDHFSSAFFINQDTCFFTDNSSQGGIYKSTDGGFTLDQKSSHSASNVFFLDINNGWAVGRNGILKSTDNGETWSNKTSFIGSDIKFYNNNIGMCVGIDDILVSTDGGETWSSKTGPSLNTINFINSTTVWGYTSEGTIYKTTNFGDTWNSLNTGLGYGNTVFFINEYTGWVGGQDYLFNYSLEPVPPTNHFTKVWSGNPYAPMNIYVTSATIDGTELVAGDEVGVFDGDICVGSVVLTEPIPSGGYVSIITSTDDPTTTSVDGFIAGHSITYKLWIASSSREVTRVTPLYALGNGTFISQGTALAGLTGIYTITQNVPQTSGWNLLSLMATPENTNMLQLLNPHITSGTLIKVQDERGFAVEQLPVIGWINNIGNWQATEGYYMKVNSPSTLSVEGVPVALPLNIPLTNGWNIIGYPVPIDQNALTVLNTLITANQLIKVQNEEGQAIEQLPVIGWINNIDNFRSGEGYYLKVNTNTSLTLSNPGDSQVKVIAVKEDEENKILNKLNVNHFVPVYSSPYLPMNIYVTGVSLTGGGVIGAGDEIGIFDGNICVGAVTLIEPISSGGFVSIIASTDDPSAPGIDGFTPGHTISYRFWLSSTQTEITTYNVEYTLGDGTFASQGTALVNFESVFPVELTSFTAAVNNNTVNLKWQTATEINNYGFDVERKTESSWQKIGFVQGNGNSNSTKEYLFTDTKLVGGTRFQYRLKQIDSDGKFEYSAVVEVENIPTEYALYQNYPNPFNPTTKIRYQLPKQSKVVIKIYNILGSEVLELLNENKEPGVYEVEFNASNLSSGTYIYKISADNFVQTKKMLLMK